ncbi:MAG: phosphoribosylamine--glycine ligase, partial [Candidatus Adiutrix sp.]|nr:phosphoribosylamine--glycine ligase [Candidatus Adiutrix sp.]
ECTPLKADDLTGLTNFALREDIDLVVIGPELPLALGLTDKMELAGLRVFGPAAAGARLESSKKFAKDFMARHNIPTAAYRVFSELEGALRYLEGRPEGPVVVKASGLAQGKGVTVAASRAEAAAAAREALEGGRFGEAGNEVVIEDFILGEEVSLLTFTDGKTLIPMPPVQDHKRVGEGDGGPNTGGMGAYGPVRIYTEEVAEAVRRTIIEPVLRGLAADKIDYRGCLYIGLMLPAEGSNYQGPQVIEFNARFGDPETEVLMPLLESDLAEIMLRCAAGELGGIEVKWRRGAAACVVMASAGYPGEYLTGFPIKGGTPPDNGEAIAFHAGVARARGGGLTTAGGRVLTVTAAAPDLRAALAAVYKRIETISFEGAYYRRDIGHRELKRLQEA